MSEFVVVTHVVITHDGKLEPIAKIMASSVEFYTGIFRTAFGTNWETLLYTNGLRNFEGECSLFGGFKVYEEKAVEQQVSEIPLVVNRLRPTEHNIVQLKTSTDRPFSLGREDASLSEYSDAKVVLKPTTGCFVHYDFVVILLLHLVNNQNCQIRQSDRDFSDVDLQEFFEMLLLFKHRRAYDLTFVKVL